MACGRHVSGSNYLRRMSESPAGEWMTDWDGLYWTFIDDHREVFAWNQLSRMEVSLLDAMDPEKRREHRRRAEALLGAGHGATRLLRTATAIEGPHALS
jgi:deoxyribodipyrimidine photolyase-related protein